MNDLLLSPEIDLGNNAINKVDLSLKLNFSLVVVLRAQS